MTSRKTTEIYNTVCHVVDGNTVVVQGSRFVRERTCKFVPFVEEDGSVFVENCSECDCPVIARCTLNYCPNCGAKVVE